MIESAGRLHQQPIFASLHPSSNPLERSAVVTHRSNFVRFLVSLRVAKHKLTFLRIAAGIYGRSGILGGDLPKVTEVPVTDRSEGLCGRQPAHWPCQAQHTGDRNRENELQLARGDLLRGDRKSHVAVLAARKDGAGCEPYCNRRPKVRCVGKPRRNRRDDWASCAGGWLIVLRCSHT